MSNDRLDAVIEKAKAFCEANYDEGFDRYVECYSRADWEKEVVYSWYDHKVNFGTAKEGEVMTWAEVRSNLIKWVRLMDTMDSADECGEY